jgi:hypothetical protein
VNMGLIFFAIAPIVLMLVLMGHWGNVVDEIATEDQDELPRPLRSVSLYDDIWSPSVAAGMALMPVVLPTWFMVTFLGGPDPHSAFGVIVLAVVAGATLLALLAAPAVLLTKMTSGSWANLRPDRTLGVAATGGVEYWKAAALGLIALPVYLYGCVVSVYSLILAMSPIPANGTWAQPWAMPLAWLMMGVGVYLMHAFCWRLGLVYRAHHRRFPWVDQERIRQVKPVDRLSPEARRRLLERKQATVRGGVLGQERPAS